MKLVPNRSQTKQNTNNKCLNTLLVKLQCFAMQAGRRSRRQVQWGGRAEGAESGGGQEEGRAACRSLFLERRPRCEAASYLRGRKMALKIQFLISAYG